MLPAAHRLSGNTNFKQLAQKGRLFFSPHISLRAMPNDRDITRFAFVVSTKVSKKAVVRNTVKRRMREIVRHALHDIRPGFDILLIAKKDTPQLTYTALEQQVKGILEKSRLINAQQNH